MMELWMFLAGFAAGCVLGGGAICLWARARVSSLQALAEAGRAELAGVQTKADEVQRENRDLAGKLVVARRELEILREQADKERERNDRNLREQLRLVQEQLQNATREMLGRRTEELSKANTEQMAAIINPLRETIGEMRTAMDRTRDVHSRNAAALEKSIEEVMKRTVQIGEEADKLASALRNENKVQGNWGELILDELLESQGLKEGLHYEKQATMRDNRGTAILNEETGHRMVPDTILHFPDGKDAIIDSKVSLKAFVDYQNAEDDAARAEALQRHVKSVRRHVDELARKDYSAYVRPPRQSLNYVFMFVPNEGALQLALAEDPLLWREAFAKGVFITGEQNLTAALRIIQVAWTQELQAQNQEKIFDTARMLLDRVADFVAHFERVGEKLNEATECYRKAGDKLKDGRQSVVGAAQNLIKLGAKTKKHIPEADEPLKGVE